MRICRMLFMLCCMTAATDAAGAAEVIPALKAHAHNDYYHDRPLLDALAEGFCSVEADVFLVDGKLLVGHSKRELKPERTLEKLYLDPLRELVKKNGGRVYAEVPTVTLLVDIKSNGKETYEALQQILTRYSGLLTSVKDDKVVAGAVQIVVSGNRDVETIAKSNPRFVGVDGRLSDLTSDRPAHLMPMISDNWRSHFKWRGDGEIPAKEREKLAQIVQKAHAAKRTVRLWATPESESLWGELLKADVDHINTDQLGRLSRFLRESTKE